MPITEAQRRAKDKWKAKNMKRVPLDLRNEEYDALKEYCFERNLTVNGFIRDLIREAIKQPDNQ